MMPRFDVCMQRFRYYDIIAILHFELIVLAVKIFIAIDLSIIYILLIPILLKPIRFTNFNHTSHNKNLFALSQHPRLQLLDSVEICQWSDSH